MHAVVYYGRTDWLKRVISNVSKSLFFLGCVVDVLSTIIVLLHCIENIVYIQCAMMPNMVIVML